MQLGLLANKVPNEFTLSVQSELLVHKAPNQPISLAPLGSSVHKAFN